MQNTTWRRQLTGYYRAFELIFAAIRQKGEYRTHFGISSLPDEDYCIFKASFRPNRYGEMYAQMIGGMDDLVNRVFSPLSGREIRSILDLGCGAGGTLHFLHSAFPSARLTGVNLNPYQMQSARSLLGGQERVSLIEADFMEYENSESYDLIYCMESAFHNRDKAALVQKIASLLSPNGELIVIDIFFAERAARRLNSRQTGEALFHYMDPPSWERLLRENQMEPYHFEDLSESVANHITIRSTLEEYNAMLTPALANHPDEGELRESLIHAYHGYKKLGKFMQRGFLQYGILRARKNASFEK